VICGGCFLDLQYQVVTVTMTEPGIYYPHELGTDQLDAFLEKGWYRMGQGIFTTHYIVQQDEVYRVWWLRYALKHWTLSVASKKIKKSNRHFTVEIVPMHINEAIETLYSQYRSQLDFEPATSVQHWLYDIADKNIYDSWLIQIKDGEQLIAAGIFDNGLFSIAGIMNFYHPDYKKYSLGKYMMLLKMEYAQANGKHWYYPGYIVQHYPKFDYKLFAGKNAAQIFIPEFNRWVWWSDDLLTGME
jgi:arginine-tRNA-protein transferase